MTTDGFYACPTAAEWFAFDSERVANQAAIALRPTAAVVWWCSLVSEPWSGEIDDREEVA